MADQLSIDPRWAELYKILLDMDVPAERFNSIFWLSRNLGILNGDHEKFGRAMELLRELITEARRGNHGTRDV